MRGVCAADFLLVSNPCDGCGVAAMVGMFCSLCSMLKAGASLLLVPMSWGCSSQPYFGYPKHRSRRALRDRILLLEALSQECRSLC